MPNLTFNNGTGNNEQIAKICYLMESMGYKPLIKLRRKEVNAYFKDRTCLDTFAPQKHLVAETKHSIMFSP